MVFHVVTRVVVIVSWVVTIEGEFTCPRNCNARYIPQYASGGQSKQRYENSDSFIVIIVKQHLTLRCGWVSCLLFSRVSLKFLL